MDLTHILKFYPCAALLAGQLHHLLGPCFYPLAQRIQLIFGRVRQCFTLGLPVGISAWVMGGRLGQINGHRLFLWLGSNKSRGRASLVGTFHRAFFCFFFYFLFVLCRRIFGRRYMGTIRAMPLFIAQCILLTVFLRHCQSPLLLDQMAKREFWKR